MNRLMHMLLAKVMENHHLDFETDRLFPKLEKHRLTCFRCLDAKEARFFDKCFQIKVWPFKQQVGLTPITLYTKYIEEVPMRGGKWWKHAYCGNECFIFLYAYIYIMMQHFVKSDVSQLHPSCRAALQM